MSTSILASTLLLTMLMLVGLVFFIRASVKDRTQVVKLRTPQSEEALLPQLQQYFDQRSYRVVAVDPNQEQVTFEGYVRPSLFLAIFLTLLAATGVFCLVLVLSILLPGITNVLFGLVFLSPGAGIFYWQKAGRPEQVSLKIESLNDNSLHNVARSLITVTAHRDELAELQKTLRLEAVES